MINVFPWLRKIYAKDITTGQYKTDAKGLKIVINKKWQLGYETYIVKDKVRTKVSKNISIHKIDPELPNTYSGALKALKMFNPPGIVKSNSNSYFSEFAKIVLKDIKSSYRESTYECYKLSVNNFLEFIDDKPLKMYRYEDIIKFKNERSDSFIKSIKREGVKKRLVSSSSVNIDLRNIHHIFQEAILYKYIDENPCNEVEPRRTPKNLKLGFKNPQLQQVLSSFEKLKRNMALYSVHSGCRISEVIFAEESDMEFENGITLDKLVNIKISEPDNWPEFVKSVSGFINVRNKPYFEIKDYEERRIPMSTQIIELLVDLREERGNVIDIIEYKYKGEVHNIVGNIWNHLYNKDTISHYTTSVLRKLGYSKSYTFH